MPRSVVGARLAAKHALKGRPELGAEDGVDDGVEGGVEVPEPEEEGDESVIKLGVFEDGHDDGQDEERKPAGDEGARHDGQGLGGLPLSLGLQGHVLLLAQLGGIVTILFILSQCYKMVYVQMFQITCRSKVPVLMKTSFKHPIMQ